MWLKINGSIALSSILSIGPSFAWEWSTEEEDVYSCAFAVYGVAGTAGRDISSGLNYFLVFALPEHPALSSYSLTKGRAGRGGALLCHSCCYSCCK